MWKELKLSGKQISSCSFFSFCKHQEKEPRGTTKSLAFEGKSSQQVCIYNNNQSCHNQQNIDRQKKKKKGFCFLFVSARGPTLQSRGNSSGRLFIDWDWTFSVFFPSFLTMHLHRCQMLKPGMKSGWPTYAGGGESPVCTPIVAPLEVCLQKLQHMHTNPERLPPHPPPPPPATNWRFPLALSPNFRCPE